MDDERIRRRAHEIWQREGSPDGRQHVHWEQARHELEAEEEAAAPAALDAAAAQPPVPGPVARNAVKAVRGRRKAPGSDEESGGAA